MSKPIKALKDLRVFRGCACYRHSGPTDLREQATFFFVLLSVVCDRLITNSSGSLGIYARASDDPALQGLARGRWRRKPARLRVWHARALVLR